METATDTIDRVVNYQVTSTPEMSAAAYPFDGSTEYGATFSVMDAVPMSITVARVASLVNAERTTTSMFTRIPVATHCRVWSKKTFLPSTIQLQITRDGDDDPVDMPVRAAGLTWQQAENGLQVTTIVLDERNKAPVQSYTFVFGADAESTTEREVHIYRIKLLHEVQYEGDDANLYTDTSEAATNPGPCQKMPFTGSNENKTLERMNEQMGGTLANTQCDDLLQTSFDTYAAAKADMVTTADFESEVTARTDAKMKGEAGWGGASAETSVSASGRAKVKAAATNDLKTEMAGSLSAGFTKRLRGCEAITAMAQLMASAQKEATCVMTKLNSTMATEVGIKQTINASVGDVEDSNLEIRNKSNIVMKVSFASSSEVDSTLTAIMSTMLDSMTDIDNSMSSEGLFVPSVGAKTFGVGASTSVAESSKTFANEVVTKQMAILRMDQEINFSAGNVLRSDIKLTNEIAIEAIAGMMVDAAFKTALDSTMTAELKSKITAVNTASSKGLSFDFLGMLLYPCLVLVGLVLSVFMVKRLASKYVLLFAVLLLAGSIAGIVLSDDIGVYICGGIGIATALYLFYLAWSRRRKGPSPSPPTPVVDPSPPSATVTDTATAAEVADDSPAPSLAPTEEPQTAK